MKLDDVKKLASFELRRIPEDQQQIQDLLLSMGIDPKNLYQELEMSSPLVNTDRDISYYNNPVNLHSHDYIEILYCHTSANVEYLIGPNRYRLQKGDIIFIPPGISHRPILPESMPVPYERDVLWISQEFVKKFGGLSSAEPLDYAVPIRTGGTRWESLGELFRMGVVEEEEKRPGWELAVIGNTITILAQMKRAYAERSSGTLRAEKPELLDRITAYIERHYAERITVSELARRFYVSDSSISHQFKQKMGVSIYHYVTQRRLICAKNLIAEGVALEQIATQIGFSDYSAFYRAFKQEFGISPRQYRQKIL